jgi:hypothetical protein
MHNAATLLRPLPFDRAGEVLDEVEGFFDGPGRGEAYLWSAWPTPDLRPGRGADLPAVGVFSDLSRPSAEALGFLPITRFTLWHRPR